MKKNNANKWNGILKSLSKRRHLGVIINWKLKVSTRSSHNIKTKLSISKCQQRISTDKQTKSKFFWTLKPILHFILHSIKFHCSIREGSIRSFIYLNMEWQGYVFSYMVLTTLWLNTCPMDIDNTFKHTKRKTKEKKNTESKGKRKRNTW